MFVSKLGPHSNLKHRIISGTTKAPLSWKVKNFPNIFKGWLKMKEAQILNIPSHYAQLYLKVLKADGTRVDYGLVSTRVITTAAVAYLASGLVDSSVDVSTFRYHALGTDNSPAPAAADTALEMEITYSGNSANRNSGTNTPTSATVAGNATYTTIATNSPNADASIVEHGIFSAATAGTLLDRSVFGVITLTSGDSLETTYTLTLSSGG